MVTVELDPEAQRIMGRALSELAAAADQTAEEVIKQQARLFCTDLAYITRPIGKAEVAKDHADKIRKKIGYIYITVPGAIAILKRAAGRKVAMEFRRLVAFRFFDEAAKLMEASVPTDCRWGVGPFDGGRLHVLQRFKRRVGKRLICTEKSRLTQYIQKEVRQSGFAKGGFAAAANDLGGSRGIPGFATRHFSAPGKGVVQKVGDSISVIIENSVDHIELAFDYRQEIAATQARMGKIEKLIKRILDNKAKKISPSLQ